MDAIYNANFGSIERLGAPNFQRWGKVEGGGSGWVLLMYSPRDKRLVNINWAADHTNAIAGGQPVIAPRHVRTPLITWTYGAKGQAGYVDAFMESDQLGQCRQVFTIATVAPG